MRGHVALAEHTLVDVVGLRTGAPWSEAAVEEGRRLLERAYARRGYHAVAIEPRSTRRNGVVDVEYRVVEGSPTRIGRVVYRSAGNRRHYRRSVDFLSSLV